MFFQVSDVATSVIEKHPERDSGFCDDMFLDHV
jgi:hypothetical protein